MCRNNLYPVNNESVVFSTLARCLALCTFRNTPAAIMQRMLKRIKVNILVCVCSDRWARHVEEGECWRQGWNPLLGIRVSQGE